MVWPLTGPPSGTWQGLQELCPVSCVAVVQVFSPFPSRPYHVRHTGLPSLAVLLVKSDRTTVHGLRAP